MAENAHVLPPRRWRIAGTFMRKWSLQKRIERCRQFPSTRGRLVQVESSQAGRVEIRRRLKNLNTRFGNI